MDTMHTDTVAAVLKRLPVPDLLALIASSVDNPEAKAECQRLAWHLNRTIDDLAGMLAEALTTTRQPDLFGGYTPAQRTTPTRIGVVGVSA
jgi:hypothetical protein